ncbi:MAG: ABC transporter substrate-binding protein, partial [Acetobacteraceae bacterium]|nr:ABC transporter substrate-binding protein [Acetobacteraceae bacterium]
MKLTRRQTLSSVIAAAAAGTLPRHVLAQSGGKTLVVGIAADPTGLDPEAVENNTSGFIMAAIYDSLVRYKTGSTEVEPGVAERWDVSPDGMQYTFHLRQGITFHDGTKLDAKAYVETVARQLDKSSPIYIYNTGPVEGYEEFTFGPVESYRAAGELAVEFKMKQPSAGFLNSLAMVWNGIVSPAAAAKYGKEFRNNPVGTGPFVFKEYRPRDQVVLEANPNYWRGKPKLAGLVYKILPDPQAALLALRRGEVQILADVGAPTIPALRQEASVNVVSQPGLAVSGVSLPCDVKPFDDVRVRRALNLAVDKQAINRALFQGLADVMTSPLPPAQWGFDKSIQGYGFDPEQAKKLLAEAGVQAGFRVEFLTYNSPRGYNSAGADLAVAVQGYLRRVGIETDLRRMDMGAYLSTVRSGKYPGLRMGGWTGDNGDPDNFAGALFGSKEIPINNTSHYSNPDVDKMLADAAREVDHDKRIQLYSKIQRQIVDDAPWIFINYTQQI